MDADLDTFATALYVSTDDLLAAHPERVPVRPATGFAPKISDAELLTLAVMQALLGYTSEGRRPRYAHKNLRGMFPTLSQQSGCNKRPRKLPATMTWLMSDLGQQTSITDETCGWSTPPRSSVAAPWRRPIARTWQGGPNTATAPPTRGTSGDSACTSSPPLHGLPSAYALTGAKATERTVLTDVIATEPALTAAGPGP